ncbi:MAG TPA: hypothetical protein VN690_04610 [Terriglobales bacterium]|nr:hypothetical protein [Terriglobales bacterium]
MSPRYDPRTLSRKTADLVVAWTYILGLSIMILVWASVAFATIGNGSHVHPDYHLADPTPAAQPGNTLLK